MFIILSMKPSSFTRTTAQDAKTLFNSRKVTACLILLLWLALSGCSPSIHPADSLQNDTPYFLPYPESSATPEGEMDAGANTPDQPTPVAQRDPAEVPTSRADCVDVLTFISDLTIPDGTVVLPDSTMDKRWEVENSGNCNWDETYRLRLIAGPDLGAQTEQALYPARSGSRAVIRILFKAPLEPGAYRSAWQAANPNGDLFGDPFFIDFIVSDGSAGEDDQENPQ